MVGVCYLTAHPATGGDIDELVVSLVMTRDVSTSELAIRHVRGFGAVCGALEIWMTQMCEESSQPS